MFSRITQRVAMRAFGARARASAPRFRRTAALFSGVAAGAFVGGVTFVCCAAKAPPFDIEALRTDIADLILDHMELGPMFVRLAWHEAGSWDCKKKDGAPNSASMRFKPECSYAGNSGLDEARKALEPLKKKYPNISYADLWVLAAYVAIESMSGPTIPFSWGRVDATDSSQCGPDGRLPDGGKTQKHVREVFTRIGFNDRETVALIGAHTCGECRLKNTGFVGPWTFDKNGFDNTFFIALLKQKWVVNPDVEQMQFMDDETKGTMMLPSDMALILDPVYKKYVTMYAKDNDKFCADFSAAFKKLTELNTKNLTPEH